MTTLRWAALAAVLAAAACGGNKTTTPTVPIPVYNGSWIGNYTITSCIQNGQFAAVDVCSLFTNGQVLPDSFLFSQTDRNVSGTFLLGSLNFAFPTSTIASDGGLTITGSGTAPGFGEVVNVTPTWSLRLTGTTLTGSIVQVWVGAGLTGQATINGSMSTSTKTAVVASQTAPAAVAPRSIKDVWSALTTAAQP